MSEKQFDWVLLLDDDMVIDEDTIPELISSASKMPGVCVSATYVHRKNPERLACTLVCPPCTQEFSEDMRRFEFHPILGGLGCFLIPADVWKASRDWYPTAQMLSGSSDRVPIRFRSTWSEAPDVDDVNQIGRTKYDETLSAGFLRAQWLGEDYRWCKDLWDHQVPVILDTAVRVGHMCPTTVRPKEYHTDIGTWMTRDEVVRKMSEGVDPEVSAVCLF